MLFVWIFLLVGTFFLIALVDFVLRNPMFAETFVIKLGIPFTKVELVKENVEFIYIIAGSIFLGAFIIALSTWVLDARRKFKVRSLRKELKHLEKEVKEARASLPEQQDTSVVDAGTTEAEEKTVEPADVSAVSPDAEAMPTDVSEVSPEDITKSFEDVVEDSGDVDESEVEDESDSAPMEPFVPEEEDESDNVSVEQSISEEETAEEVSEEPLSEVTVTEETTEGVSEELLPEVTAIEAEVVESEEVSTGEDRKEKDGKGSDA